MNPAPRVGVHALRQRLRDGLSSRPSGHLSGGLLGTFIKLPVPSVLDLCCAAGFDFAVIDLEHSTLTEADAIALVRHAELLGFAALVRVPTIDAALINRLLENGATGLQLSMLRTTAQTAALRSATQFAPVGSRSVSLANPVAGYGAIALTDLLRAERDSPPVLVGQIETAVSEPIADVIAGLDVAFVGGTDLSVSLGLSPGDAAFAAAVDNVRQAARVAGVRFGGWSPWPSVDGDVISATADYLVTGSDLQFLATTLHTVPTKPRRSKLVAQSYPGRGSNCETNFEEAPSEELNG